MIARYRRTLFLAVLACGTFVWAAIDKFDVSPRELGILFLYCVAVVLLMAVLAAIAVAACVLVGRLWARLRGDGVRNE